MRVRATDPSGQYVEKVLTVTVTDVNEALPAYTELAAFNGKGLDSTWQFTGQRSAFLASFAR